MVENHLETLIIKHFDPKKADSIFSAEGEVNLSSIYFLSILLLIFNFLNVQSKIMLIMPLKCDSVAFQVESLLAGPSCSKNG